MSNHLETDEYKKLHKPVRDDTEGGACLSGRCRANYDTVTCSYRYQGIKAAASYKNIYNSKDIKEIYHLGEENTRAAVVAAISKKDVRRQIAVNGVYRVVEGTKEFKVEPFRRKSDGKVYSSYEHDDHLLMRQHWFVNFTISALPWRNQVHHVLNHSSMQKVIASFENISEVITKGLLGELYNINHKDNVVILPTEDKWSRVTGLPAHASHPAYSKLVLKDVKNALAEYDDINDEAESEDHPKPDSVAVKSELLKVSQKWYEKIMKVVPDNKDVNKPLTCVNQIT